MIMQCSSCNPDNFKLSWGPAGRYFVQSSKKLGGYFFMDSEKMYAMSIFVSQHEMGTMLKEMIPTLESAEEMYSRNTEKMDPEKKIKSCTVISNRLEEEPTTRYEVSTCDGITFKKYLCWRDDHSIDCTELDTKELNTFQVLCNSYTFVCEAGTKNG